MRIRMENINIDVKKKKETTSFVFYNPALFGFSLWETQSHGTLFFLLLLHPLSPLSLSSQTSCFLFPSIKPLPFRTPLRPGGRKPARHPETAGVDTFRLQVTRCCLNAHLSETSPSPLEGKTKGQKKEKRKKSFQRINLKEMNRKIPLMTQ